MADNSDRFRDVFFSRILDKDGNDVTRERMAKKVLRECRICAIPINVIEEDLDIVDLLCPVCRKEAAVAAV